MTVLQMRGSDEESQLPQKKRRLSSRHHSEYTRQTNQAWITAENQENTAASFHMPAAPETMNGFGISDPFHQVPRLVEEDCYNDSISPIAPLSNLGNTCFLNSVLYTLRFVPSFLHKLHHLHSECVLFSKQLNANKQDKTYSVNKNNLKSQANNKDAFFCGTNCCEMKTQTVISKLHSLYASLHLNETKDRITEPFQPTSFIQALREVNPIFEGNQQHDAHELLVCILDIIREVCELLYQQNNVTERLTPSCTTVSTGSALKSLRKSLKFGKIIRSDKKTTCLPENHSEGDMKKYLVNGDCPNKDDSNLLYFDDLYPMNQNTIFEDFQGISLLKTTCLECEQVTERKETFCDICVPIETIDDCDDVEAVDQLYKSIIVTEEYLIGCNKYWCEKCSRYNEAKRCVKYEKLPKLLTLHLKRFSSSYGNSVSKVNEHMPTPFTLHCFCEQCLQVDETGERPHYYNLYAIIMHIGPSPASGHYTAYVKTFDASQDYAFCARDKPKTSSLSRGLSINNVSVNHSNGLLDKSPISFSKYLPKFSSKSINGGIGQGVTKEQDLPGKMLLTCKGIECCGIRLRSKTPSMQDPNGIWLHCDDEQVNVISVNELAHKLSPMSSESSTLTPYLLFYSRVDVNS